MVRGKKNKNKPTQRALSPELEPVNAFASSGKKWMVPWIGGGEGGDGSHGRDGLDGEEDRFAKDL